MAILERGGQIQKPSGKSNSSKVKNHRIFSVLFLTIQNGRCVQVGYVGLLKHELFLDFQVYLDSN